MQANRNTDLVKKVGDMLKRKVKESYAPHSGLDERSFNIAVDFAFSVIASVYQSWFNSKRRESLEEIARTLNTLCFKSVNGLRKQPREQCF